MWLFRIENGENFCEGETDGRIRDGNIGGQDFVEACGVADVGLSGWGSEDPDVLDAHGEVFVHLLLEAFEGVFGREYFNA
jgi:hypothetical protein